MCALKYDLEERTTIFGEKIIELCSLIKPTFVSKNCINQLLRAATSVGANYHEANGASSKKDFRNKIAICKKEIQETKFWLRILKKCNPERTETIDTLWEEAQELTLIFHRIKSTLDKKSK